MSFYDDYDDDEDDETIAMATIHKNNHYFTGGIPISLLLFVTSFLLIRISSW